MKTNQKFIKLSAHPARAFSRFQQAARVLGLIWGVAAPVSAQSTWNVASGSSPWGTAGNWSPAGVPAGTGAAVVFNGAATGSNTAQTGNRTITMDTPQTAGSIIFNNDLGTFSNSLTGPSSTPGAISFDAWGAGPATITTTGTGLGTGNNTISAPMSLLDPLVVTINNTAVSSTAGSLNLSGSMTGAGGFTKQGDGMATFGSGAKTYKGDTVIAGGRMRVSLAAAPTDTSSLTVSAGGQLTLISAGSYTFGPGTVSLAGAGATSGPYASFPGAIRNDTNLATTITNLVNLVADTLIHVQGAASGAVNFSNTVSGPGQLALTAPGSDTNLGRISLGGANTYSGGTLVRGGLVTLNSTAATFGTGDVTVLSGNAMIAGASARIEITAGTLNAINDVATLSLAGGGTAGTADDGYVTLGSGINETVGGLVLAGAAQLPGTYGSSTSGAAFQNDEYFSGPGMLTVVPEPAALSLSALGMITLFRRTRRRCCLI